MKTLTEILAAIAALFQSPETAAANRARRNLARNSANIADAERLVAALKVQRVDEAKADADALALAIENATSETEKAELRRQAAVDAINNATDKRIKALEEAIAAARQVGADKLGRLAEKQSAARNAETTRIEDAKQALGEVSNVGDGNTAK